MVIRNNLAKLPILGAVMTIATAAHAADAMRPVPRFEKADCAVQVVPGERIECGFLYVPENRRKARSRTISLPVMIFRSTGAAPAADPVVYLPGGPGLSSIDGRTTGKGNPFLMERDQILLEGRATPLPGRRSRVPTSTVCARRTPLLPRRPRRLYDVGRRWSHPGSISIAIPRPKPPTTSMISAGCWVSGNGT